MNDPEYSIPKKGTELMPQLVDLLKYHEGNAATYGSICMCIANIILSRRMLLLINNEKNICYLIKYAK